MLLLTGALKYLNKLFLTVYSKYVLSSLYADIQIIIILNCHFVLQHMIMSNIIYLLMELFLVILPCILLCNIFIHILIYTCIKVSLEYTPTNRISVS